MDVGVRGLADVGRPDSARVPPDTGQCALAMCAGRGRWRRLGAERLPARLRRPLESFARAGALDVHFVEVAA